MNQNCIVCICVSKKEATIPGISKTLDNPNITSCGKNSPSIPCLGTIIGSGKMVAKRITDRERERERGRESCKYH